MAQIAAFCLLLIVSSTGRADELTSIRQRLELHPRIRADFVQTRRMAELQRPLVARGKLLVWGSTGVIWEIEQPVRAAYVLRDATTIEVADGRETVHSAQDDAGSVRIGRILRALVHGDTTSLEQWFEIGARAGAGRWTITLVPRQGPLASFLKSMQVSGADYVEGVLVEETGGDATQIHFRNQREGVSLTEEERRLLGAD
jgi:hypothetical protein